MQAFSDLLPPAPTELRGRREIKAVCGVGRGVGSETWGARPPLPDSLPGNPAARTRGPGAGSGLADRSPLGKHAPYPEGDVFVDIAVAPTGRRWNSDRSWRLLSAAGFHLMA